MSLGDDLGAVPHKGHDVASAQLTGYHDEQWLLLVERPGAGRVGTPADPVRGLLGPDEFAADVPVFMGSVEEAPGDGRTVGRRLAVPGGDDGYPRQSGSGPKRSCELGSPSRDQPAAAEGSDGPTEVEQGSQCAASGPVDHVDGDEVAHLGTVEPAPVESSQ